MPDAIDRDRADGRAAVDAEQRRLPVDERAHEQVILRGTLERQRLELRVLRRISGARPARLRLRLKNCCCAAAKLGARTAAASKVAAILVERKTRREVNTRR
jgi:hypothetical protein